jgi:hypothetical protein
MDGIIRKCAVPEGSLEEEEEVEVERDISVLH